jgi:hypothetical protein
MYGFTEFSKKYILDSEYLKEYCCDVFIEDLSDKWYSKSGICYGVQCGLDKKIGQLIISDEEKQLVHDLHKKYVEFKKKINQNFEEPEICYYFCLDGDIDYYNKVEYTFEDTLNEDEEEEEEEEDDYNN